MPFIILLNKKVKPKQNKKETLLKSRITRNGLSPALTTVINNEDNPETGYLPLLTTFTSSFYIM